MSHFISPQNKLSGHIMNTKQHGFSLIEFMVASAISMIVLLAAGSTYFTTTKLKQETQNKVSTQQDLRNAGDLIRRDLRQAGDFGCLAAPDSPTIQSLFGSAFNNKTYISTTIPGGFPTDIAITGNPLVIIYGDKTAQSNPKCGDPTTADHVAAIAYVVGKTPMDTNDNLYRLVRDRSIVGSVGWTSAQMIAENVKAMSNQFQYIDTSPAAPKCPVKVADTTPNPVKMQLTGLSNLDTSQPNLPVLAETKFIVSIPDPTSSTIGATKDYEYAMKTMIQQGNICLKETLQGS